MPEDFMTLQEVQDYWKVSRNTARKYILEREIQEYSLGRNIRYRKEDIENALIPVER